MPVLIFTPAKPPRITDVAVTVRFGGTFTNQANGRAVMKWIDLEGGEYFVTETNNVYKMPNTEDPIGIKAKLQDLDPPKRGVKH